jgi:hypothetical protein
VIPDDRLWEIEERYRGSFAVDPLSYGTSPTAETTSPASHGPPGT